MEAFQILPVADLAAIFQNGRYLPLASLNMYHNLPFVDARGDKSAIGDKYCTITHTCVLTKY